MDDRNLQNTNGFASFRLLSYSRDTKTFKIFPVTNKRNLDTIIKL